MCREAVELLAGQQQAVFGLEIAAAMTGMGIQQCRGECCQRGQGGHDGDGQAQACGACGLGLRHESLVLLRVEVAVDARGRYGAQQRVLGCGEPQQGIARGAVVARGRVVCGQGAQVRGRHGCLGVGAGHDDGGAVAAAGREVYARQCGTLLHRQPQRVGVEAAQGDGGDFGMARTESGRRALAQGRGL